MRPKGPYGREILWGYDFVKTYREPLSDLYCNPEFLSLAESVHYRSLVGEGAGINKEKQLCVADFAAKLCAERFDSYRFIVDEVVKKGLSAHSADISIQCCMILAKAGDINLSDLNADLINKPSNDALIAAVRKEPTREKKPKPYRWTGGPISDTAPRATGDGRSCANCSYSRNPDYCSQMTVCDDWKPAKVVPEYWPTWDDMRKAQRDDYRSRRNDLY